MRQRNKDYDREYGRRWRAANGERLRVRDRERYAANPEPKRASNRKWNAAHREYARQKARKWYARNRKRALAACRLYRLRAKYGLTHEQYAVLLAAQGGACKICRGAFRTTPHVDHDHKTNKVRGLLCSKCNRGLGDFSDNVEHLRSAIAYLTGSA